MTNVAYMTSAQSEPRGFAYAVAAARAAEMIDQTIAACGQALTEMVGASSELKLQTGLTQPVFESTLATVTSLVEGRAAMARSRRVARGLADRAGLTLAWGDHGCPGITEE